MQRGRGIGGITGRAFLTVADALELARVAADVQRSLASHDTTVRKSEVTSSFALAIMRTRATLRAERKQAERDAERKQGDSDAEDTLSCSSSSSSGMSVSSGSEQEDDADNLLLEEGEEGEQESNASEDGEDEQESDASEDGEAARGAVDESPSAQRIATDSKRAPPDVNLRWPRCSPKRRILSRLRGLCVCCRACSFPPTLADLSPWCLEREAFLPRDKEGNRKARAVANARSRQARLRLRAQMGAAWRPMLGLYSGHYCLDLRRPLDMLAASKLAAAAAAEAAFSRLHSRAKRVDSSQRGNWENFRCESAGTASGCAERGLVSCGASEHASIRGAALRVRPDDTAGHEASACSRANATMRLSNVGA